jgi:uncharacterized protein (DUF169 family)
VTQKDWSELIRSIESYLRLKTFPVGFKFLTEAEELQKYGKIRIAKHNSFTCQLITIARTYGWTIGVPQGNLMPVCGSMLGFCEMADQVKDGTLRSIAWCETKEDAKKFEEAIPRLPFGKYKAVLIGPAGQGNFDPDFVMFYGNPAQMILIINALQFKDYERFEFYCVGESSCSDAIVQCFLSQKPSLTIPCFGERRYGHAQDDELVISLTPAHIAKVRRNLEELSKRGIRYPIAYFGATVDLSVGLPSQYHTILNIEG